MYLCTYEVNLFKVFKDKTVSASRDLGIEYSGNKMLQCSLHRCELHLHCYLLSAVSDMCYHACIKFRNSPAFFKVLFLYKVL